MELLALSQHYIDYFNIQEHEYLNHGGQKTVFKVKIGDKLYALKIVHFPDARFEREIEINSQFQNLEGFPIIQKIEVIGEKTIILEDFIEGTDLSDIMDNYLGKENNVCKLIYEIAEVLTPVWEKKYVHRDLKPQNIRIASNGKPFILDFGIARALEERSLTDTGIQPLSWLYSSPEQYAGNKKLISYRTDFFCLGIIAYRLYTGELPFGNSPEGIRKTFEQKQLKLITNSEKISSFCNQCLLFSPSQRPGKITQFKKLLQ